MGLRCITRHSSGTGISFWGRCSLAVRLEFDPDVFAGDVFAMEFNVDRFTIAAEDLPSFCELLWLVDLGKRPEMSLTFESLAGSRLPVMNQRLLLLPFKRLWPIRNICASDNFNDDIVAELKMAMACKKPITVAALIDTVIALRYEAWQAACQRNFVEGAIKYMQGVYVCRGLSPLYVPGLDVSNRLNGGPFDGQSLWQADERLMFDMYLNLSRLYRETGHDDLGTIMVVKALDLPANALSSNGITFITDADCAEIWIERAQLHQLRGESRSAH
ncbi:MAG: hypothetical protein M1812_004042 [Candelaria pacifica]|nr:MAG: hypothetical protein M1812_004042 [Candelaria pacifica]